MSKGQVVTGQVIDGDNAYLPASYAASIDERFYRDAYALEVEHQERVFFDVASDFDAVIVLFGPDERAIGEVPILGEEHGRRIPASLRESGAHRLVIMTQHPSATGRYTLTYHDVDHAGPPLAQPVQVAAPPVSPDRAISYGQTLKGRLEASDNAWIPHFMPRGGDAYYHDGFYFEGEAGDRIVVRLACAFAPYIFLWNPDEVIVTQSSNFASPHNLDYTLEQDGLYRIVVTSDQPSAQLEGDAHYSLTVLDLDS